MIKLSSIATLLLISAMLTACSGGGSSNASAQPQENPPVIDNPSADPDIVPVGTVALAWSAPTQREDGSALSADQIAGYEVYHVEGDSGEMDIITVEGDVTQYQMSLAAGTHELGIAVVDVYGVKSQMSELQSVEIN